MQLTIQLNRRCNFSCSHCCQQMDGSEIDPSLCRRWIRSLAQAKKISRVSFTGGEAFIRYPFLRQMIACSGECGLPSSVITNGWWGADKHRMQRWLDELTADGLDQLALSYDPWHETFLGKGILRSILLAAQARGITTFLNVVFTESNRADLERAARLIIESTATFVNFAPVLPAGSGAELSLDNRTWPLEEIGGACPDRSSLVLYPDGSLKPCCTAGTHDSLGLNDIRKKTPLEALSALEADRYVRAIRSEGPQALGQYLSDEDRSTLQKKQFVSACHACHCAMQLLIPEH